LEGFDYTDPKWLFSGGFIVVVALAFWKGHLFLPREVLSRDERIDELKREVESLKLELIQNKMEAKQKDVEIKRWMELTLRGTYLVQKGVQVAKAIDQTKPKP
jgi:hypothetical protein